MPDVWLPLALGPDPEREAGGLRMVARLKPKVSLLAAQSAMKTVASALEQHYHLYRGPHGEDSGYNVSVLPLHQQIFGSLRKGLLIMLGAVGLVLLIACANVASLLLARSNARQREIAVRGALGASRKRLARQLLAEGLLLAIFGTGVGLILAQWCIRVLILLSPRDVTRLLAVRLDASVLMFAAGLAVLTALLFGSGPALLGSKADLNATLKDGGRSAASASRNRLGSGLVMAEVALSLILLAGAGLLMRSLVLLAEVDPGFNPENILTARISLPASQYSDGSRIAGFYSRLIGRIKALHEVRSASLISALPLSGAALRDPFSIEGRPWRQRGASDVPQVANFQIVAPDYFHTMKIPLLQGRNFSEHDARGAPPVAVVSRTLVRGFWPGRDPIGLHIMMGAPRPGGSWLTIVGVVGSVRNTNLDSTPIPQIYVPQQQHPSRSMAQVLEASQGAASPLPSVRSIVHELDRALPLYDVSTMDEILSHSVASRRYNATLLGLFALLAAALSAIGIYGVVSYSVSQRTHEIGIRMALGAQKSDVLKMVVGQGLKLVVIGVAIGIVGALALTRFLSSLLYGVKPTDPLTFIAVSLILIAVALAACYIPARRAAKVDPAVALRHE